MFPIAGGYFLGCPALTAPVNGYHFALGNNVGDSNYFKCRPGFTLVGDARRTCQSFQYWSGDPVDCLPEGVNTCKLILILSFCINQTRVQHRRSRRHRFYIIFSVFHHVTIAKMSVTIH